MQNSEHGFMPYYKSSDFKPIATPSNISNDINPNNLFVGETLESSSMMTVEQEKSRQTNAALDNQNGYYGFHPDAENNISNVNSMIPFDLRSDGTDDQTFDEKKFLTTNGNFILDCGTPTFLLKHYGLSEYTNEFRYMRYSAVTCEPGEFNARNFKLRQNYYGSPRETEILICITLYNEEPDLVARTLKGVMQNIIHLNKMKDHEVWGEDSWRKIVVCFVADGRNKIHPKTKALFASLGCYQEGFARSKLGPMQVKAHLYEHTTMFGFQSVEEGKITFKRNSVPTQLLFCLKESNKKKINSHRWCFEAFARDLNPNVVVLLDAGTQPSRDSIYHLWNAFHIDPTVGGCCGEIKVALGPNFKNLLNPLVAAQNFEYKMSNILDKPTESVFGFISVLPGAFSAYRYQAVLNDSDGIGPLEKYFKGETLDKDANATVFQKNMYLAEDRILCFELVSKKNSNWILKYVKSATSETDSPINISLLIKQRRRWLNGSFFASFYSIVHFWKIWQTKHSIIRKLCLQVLNLYQLIQLVVSWFAISSFFLVFRILTVALESYFGGAKILAGIFLWIYVATTVITFVFSFGNRPEGSAKMYFAIMVFYMILMAYTIFATIFISVKAVQNFEKVRSFKELVFHNSRFRDLVVSLGSTYALYFISSFLYFEPWHIFTSLIQYVLISPTYINIFSIYAFCNLHDLSWGNRDDTIVDDEPVSIEKITADDLKSHGLLGQLSNVLEEVMIKMSAPLLADEVDRQYAKLYEELNKPEESKYTINSFGCKVLKVNVDAETKERDNYAFIRSMVVLFWVGSNAAIIAVVTSVDGFTAHSNIDNSYQRRSEIFLTVILWIVAFLAAFRFVGCVLYLLGHLGENWTNWLVRRKEIRKKNWGY